jgi:hypothetical protein
MNEGVSSRRALKVLALALCLFARTPRLLAATPSTAETIAALKATIQIERQLLDEDRRRYDALERQRGEAQGRVELTRGSLDTALRQSEADAAGRLERLIDQLQGAETDRGAVLAAQLVVLERAVDRLRRLALLEVRLEELQASGEQATVGALTGSWDLTLMPAEQRGTCVLEQTGAVVQGTYQLDGGFTGSLQGTLVNRKVFLVRIDSTLGRSMELEGFLSSDGQRIRGSWLRYDLAGSEGATGQWSAQRHSETP